MISKQTIYTKGFAVGECLVCTKHKRRIRIYISYASNTNFPRKVHSVRFLSIIKGKERERERSYENKFTSFNRIFCQDDFFVAVQCTLGYISLYVELEIYQPSSVLFST